MKHIRYFFEAVLVYLVYYLFKILGLKISSYLGAKIASAIGPMLKVAKTARMNLKAAMPELSDEEACVILKDMWKNLGRTLGEFPHIPALTGDKFNHIVSVEGLENIETEDVGNKGIIFFSGHLANWEIIPKTAFEKGYPSALVYRGANNYWVDRLIRKSREKSYQGQVLLPKGQKAAKALLKHLKASGSIGMLVDQKMNDGIAVPFFGRDAMTAAALAELGLKFDVPLIPVRVERLEGVNFKVTVYPKLEIEGKTSLEIMTEVNSILESWIREKPAQWFWVHNRWPK